MENLCLNLKFRQMSKKIDKIHFIIKTENEKEIFPSLLGRTLLIYLHRIIEK